MMDREQPDSPGLSLSEQFPFDGDPDLYRCTTCHELFDPEDLDWDLNHGTCFICRDKIMDEDIRDMMAKDPIDQHGPYCQCTRCQIGDDAFIWLHHPEEY